MRARSLSTARVSAGSLVRQVTRGEHGADEITASGTVTLPAEKVRGSLCAMVDLVDRASGNVWRHQYVEPQRNASAILMIQVGYLRKPFIKC